MSMESLLDAVEDAVRTAGDYTEAQCGVQPDGMPPPSAGQMYAAIHGGAWDSADQEAHRLDEYLGVAVTLSMRTAFTPRDRVGREAVRKAKKGLYARAEVIRAALHMSYTVILAANTAMDATYTDAGRAVDGFVEPLKFSGGGRVQRQGPDWWGGSDDGEGGDPGFTLEVNFVQARRVQKLETQA